MPFTASHPTELQEGHIVNLVSKEELQNQVYTKQAIDESIKDISEELVKLQEQVNDINIKFINISPFKKFKNLFKSPN